MGFCPEVRGTIKKQEGVTMYDIPKSAIINRLPFMARLFGSRVTTQDIKDNTVCTLRAVFYRGTCYVVDTKFRIIKKE